MSTREELTLQAEKCLRQGRVDDAIAHYRDLSYLEPVEWGVVRQLADLLERAGQREGAARQFARWADYVFAEGFHAKAAALYKKVLKLDDADEHALWQLGEVSIALKLRADARVAFQRVADLRQRRGDAAGATMARERRDALEAVAAAPPMPAGLPPAYASPRPEAPVALAADAPAAPAAPAGGGPVADLPSPAVDPVFVRAPAESAPMERPNETPEARWQAVVDDEPEDLFASGAGVGPLRPALVEVPDPWGVPNPGGGPVETLTWPVVSAVNDPPEAVGAVMSASSSFDWGELLGRAVESTFVPVPMSAVEEPAVACDPPAVASPTPAPRPEEPPAIEAARADRIGDLRAQPLYVDGAPLQPSFSMPRTWLSDAPALPPDAPRRRAPEDDFFFMDDATPARWAPPQGRALTASLDEAVGESALAAPEPTAAVESPAPVEASGPGSEPGAAAADDGVQIDEEVDLTQLLEELKQWDPELPEPLRKPMHEAQAGRAAPAPSPIGPPGVDEALEAAFADLQRQGDGRAVAEQQLAAGRVFLAAGLASEAARAFERASAEPRARFEAAMALADLHRSRGQLREAVGWYEQADAAPVPDAAVKRPVLYDLAQSLEALGEPDRAVGVLLDLLSQVEDYRDARARLDRLLRADAGG